LERHRFLALLVGAFSDLVSTSRHLLEIAPTASVTRLLEEVGQGSYVGIDVDPSADGRSVQVVADLCAAPFKDGAFETSVCFHVFEHIADDLAAMREYARLLSPLGVGFIQNPWRPNRPTVEDPSASPQERLQRFGQADHVRIYGADFEDRLRSAGLDPRRVLPEQVQSEMTIRTMGITPRMPIWTVFGEQSRYRRVPSSRFEKGLRRRVDRSLRQIDPWPTSRRGHQESTSS
jgi:SAM-dependent methyltransferase